MISTLNFLFWRSEEFYECEDITNKNSTANCTKVLLSPLFNLFLFKLEFLLSGVGLSILRFKKPLFCAEFLMVLSVKVIEHFK